MWILRCLLTVFLFKHICPCSVGPCLRSIICGFYQPFVKYLLGTNLMRCYLFKNYFLERFYLISRVQIGLASQTISPCCLCNSTYTWDCLYTVPDQNPHNCTWGCGMNLNGFYCVWFSMTSSTNITFADKNNLCFYCLIFGK